MPSASSYHVLSTDGIYNVQQIARTFIKARGSVPLRPHPLAPQTGGPLQKAMGMHGRVQDKVDILFHFLAVMIESTIRVDGRNTAGTRVCRAQVQTPGSLTR